MDQPVKTVRRPPRNLSATPITHDEAQSEPEDQRLYNDVPRFAMPEETVPEPPAPDRTWSRGPAKRPALDVSGPILQWASGLVTQSRQIYAGWLVEVGRDDRLDAAMLDAEVGQVTIKHGSGNVVTHWAIETADLYFIIAGVQSIGEMKKTATRHGIAFAWSADKSTGRPRSHLRARVMLRSLLEVGYDEPFTLSMKSTQTGDILQACNYHFAVLDALDAIRSAKGKPPLAPPFYAVALTLGPGKEVTRGGTQTKTIIPVEAKIPDPITEDFIKARWCLRGWVERIESLLDDTVRWSEEESARIASGDPAQEWED